MYERSSLTVSDAVKAAHENSWRKIGNAGAFWTGTQRIAMVKAARRSLECALCRDRKSALSPNLVSGNHDGATDLPAVIIDFVHRIRTDPGRITRTVFQQVMDAGIDQGAYIEAVSVVNSSVIVDTFHEGMGLELCALPDVIDGQPDGLISGDAVHGGAWVPIAAAPSDVSETGLPTVPNIVRSMGLVPAAVDLFFGTFIPHYRLQDLDLAVSQSQAEFIASRVSALNQCFY
jgi:hypothetical protein|tara:strand:+ start:637 stop:1332 length:696 start_codon:yes stop_codon:yes gene_type:complete